jgi:hypothetical protein
MNNTGSASIGSKIRHAMTQWLLPLYKWVGVSHPRASFLVMFLFGGLIFGGMWYLTGREYQESSQKTRPPGTTDKPKVPDATKYASPVSAPPEPELTDEQKRNIVTKLVQTYRQKNKGKNPTIGWINERLKTKGLDFRVARQTQPPAAIITGGRIHDNAGDGIYNETGLPLIMDNVEIDGNKGAGITNRLPKQRQQTVKKPPEKP